MITPYNTGKVLIGCNYHPQPKPLRLSRTEQMLQDALLRKPRRIDWSGIGIVAGCMVIVVLAYAIGWASI